MKKFFVFLLSIFALSLGVTPVYSQEQWKVDLSAFQIWSDPYNPSNSDCFGVRDCFPDQPTQHHLWYFTNKNQRIWDAERIKQWVDKAVDLGVFNAINFGDDAPTFQYYRFFEVGDRESCSDGEYNLACFDELGNHCSQYPEDEISISFQMREVKKETFPNSICADKDLNIDFQVPDG